MITTFEVGSVFRIVDQASPAMRNILKSVTELDAAVMTTRKNMTGLARTRLVGVNAQISNLTRETLGLDKALGGAGAQIGRISKASASLSGATAAISGTSSAVATLANEWRSVAAAASAAATAQSAAARVRTPNLPARTGSGVPLVPPPGGGGSGGGRHGPRQGWHLGRFGASVPVAGGHVHASTVSSPAGVATGVGLFGVYELMKHAKEPLHQEAMLKLLGIDQPTIGRMSAEARDIAVSVPGSGYSQNIKNMGELYSIVGAEGAMAIAPKLAEIDRVQSIVGGKGKDQGSAYVLTRATELMGKLTDPISHQVDMKGFGAIIDNMSKMSIASHGKVTPEEWLNYAKQAGPAAGNLDINGLYTTAAIIQAMGGNRAGTAAAAIQRQFAGGVMTASKAKELETIGIFKPGDYEIGRGGHITVKNDAAKSFVDKLQKDPLDAVVKDLIPALESHGFTTNEALTKELYRILGTAPAQREVYEIIRGREQIRQERERAMGALGPGAAIKSLNENDPLQVTGAFTKAFTDLLGAIGGPLMKDAVPGLVALTNAFNNLAATAARHETTTGILSSVAAGAAAGAGVGLGIGMWGGPIGAGTGALIGSGVGAAWGIAGAVSNYLASPPSTDGASSPNASNGKGATGSWTPSTAGAPNGRDAWNVVPPSQKIEITPGKVSLNMDGRKIGEAQIAFIAREGSGPAQGSPYFDATRGTDSLDLALAG